MSNGINLYDLLDVVPNSQRQTMEIFYVPLGESQKLLIHDKVITLNVFETQDPTIFKFGVDAPRGVAINREEIYLQKKEKLQIKKND